MTEVGSEVAERPVRSSPRAGDGLVPPGGVIEGELHGLGRRFAVFMRTAVLVCASGAAVVRASPDQRPLVVGVVAGLGAWSVLYTRFAFRRWMPVADTLVITLLCLTQRWTVPPDSLGDSTNWVLAVVSITAVAHQWFTTTTGGVLLATAVVVAHFAGNALAAPETWAVSVPVGLWTFGEAGLSRVLFLFVRAGARRADQAVAASEQTRLDAAVAAARRADEREHLAVLHDTAAATLLAVGSRMVDATEPWLAEQAARDLAALAARPEFPDGEADLVRLLDQVARHAPVAVRLRSPRTMPMRATRAAAISAAAREALTNVARHAGVDTAELSVERAGDLVTVEVADQGRGFAPERVPPHRRGVSQSIEQRMARVGGRAVVTTRPGAGTRVRLESPDD
ncbi:sensor histidine kinase [Saccharothrix deserti]|uniref:sensor histidine kinase n=1 Tax=Saccharothrix deserti TaxID=2593674 RepID=UPI00131C0620|nr:ATP-binding protein [Saccharothrix deserti]